MSRKSLSENKSFRKCRLLMPKENHLISQLVGVAVEVLASSIVQVFETHQTKEVWVKIGCGVLCYVKDYVEQSFFLRLYSLKKRTVIWQHEMYNDMEYTAVKSFFHTFEGQDGIVGINFTNVQEANDFKEMINYKYKPMVTEVHDNKKKSNKSKKESKENKKKKISKLDIGRPVDFVHVSHYGLDTSFNIDPNVLDVLKEVGVSEKQMKEDKNYRKDVLRQYEISQKQAKQIRRRTKRRAPPPPPNSTRPIKNVLPPRVPNNNDGNTSSGHVTSFSPEANIPLPPPISNLNIPPPPPIANLNVPPPPPFQIPSPTSSSTTSPTPSSTTSPTPSLQNHDLDGRSALLQSIESGIKLKPISERQVSPKPDVDNRSDLGAALLSALLIREKAFSRDDSSEDSTEWEDD